jgi:hypothetical protein
VASKVFEPTRPPSEALASGTGAAREGGGRSIDDAGGGRPPRQLRPDHARPHLLRIETASRTAPPVRSFPEVLVPEGEMNATLRLSAATAAHPLLVSAPEDEEAADRLSIQPLSIEKIEIAPLLRTPLEVGAPQPTTPSTS